MVQRHERLWLHQAGRRGADVFVHISAVEKAGYTGLAEGARISYELVTGRSGKASAESLRTS